MKVFIKTYGCQANKNDSEIIAGEFVSCGDELVDSEAEAEVIFINSCSVKNKTQSKILHYIRQYYGKKKIVVGGCLVKTNNLLAQFPEIEIKDTMGLKKLGVDVVRRDKEIAIIQIAKGCLNNCTYCATKIAKGDLVSYSVEEIKRELERAVADGCKLIYLTSQDNGCYGFDVDENLVGLLRELVKIDGDYKIRVGMANPWYVMKYIDELIEVFKSDKIIKFLHIPIQSGSNKVLGEMGRVGCVAEFEKIVQKFRGAFPRSEFSDSTIATDIIVGYPTEIDEDFLLTLDLIEKIHPEVLNISVFSSRIGTEASKLKQLASEVVKGRSRELDGLYGDYRQNI